MLNAASGWILQVVSEHRCNPIVGGQTIGSTIGLFGTMSHEIRRLVLYKYRLMI